MNGGLQVHQIGKMLESVGISADQIDLKKIVDETLHLAENIENVEKEIGRNVITGKDDDTETAQEKVDEDYRKQLERDSIEDRYMQNKFAQILTVPSVALIRGRRQFGKSGCGYYLLELLSKQHDLAPCIMGLPKQKWKLLPESIRPITSLDDIPDNSVVFFDEASFKFYAESFRGGESELIDHLISVSGQKKQILLFATHHSAKLQLKIVREVDVQLFKFPSKIHSRMERREIRQFTEEAFNAFERLSLSQDKLKEYVYVISDDYTGFLKNPLPSFWSEDLSQAFADIKLETINKKKDPYVTQKQLQRLIVDMVVKKKKRKMPKTKT